MRVLGNTPTKILDFLKFGSEAMGLSAIFQGLTFYLLSVDYLDPCGHEIGCRCIFVGGEVSASSFSSEL